MPAIEGFAEIGDYIDQPVRVYSSGMQVRLAFAVATAARPDVLIVDEALSVGDAAFQRKCFQRIEGFRSAGTTLLFVSHDIETVKKLCDRALFIKTGHLAQWGPAKQVCDEYERYLFGDRKSSKASRKSQGTEQTLPTARLDPSLDASCEMVYGNGKADIEACWLADVNGQPINIVKSGTPFRWCYRVRFNEDVRGPVFAMMLKTKEGVALYGVDSKQLDVKPRDFQTGETLEVDFKLDNPLAPGVYYLNCGVRQENSDSVEFLSRRVDSALLKVTASTETSAATGLIEMRANLALGSLGRVERAR
jgi:lipopolysaccharide transport system ATP-binding protein